MENSVRQLRNQMLDYVGRLVERRKAEAMRQEEAGTQDSLSILSGNSAIDSAMAQAEEIIRSLDRVLDTRTPEIRTFRTTCNGLSRLKRARCA